MGVQADGALDRDRVAALQSGGVHPASPTAEQVYPTLPGQAVFVTSRCPGIVGVETMVPARNSSDPRDTNVVVAAGSVSADRAQAVKPGAAAAQAPKISCRPVRWQPHSRVTLRCRTAKAVSGVAARSGMSGREHR